MSEEENASKLPLSGREVQEIHELYQKETAKIREDALGFLRLAGIAIGGVFTVLAAIIAYFFGSSINDFNTANSTRLNEAESDISEFITEADEKVDELVGKSSDDVTELIAGANSTVSSIVEDAGTSISELIDGAEVKIDKIEQTIEDGISSSEIAFWTDRKVTADIAEKAKTAVELAFNDPSVRDTVNEEISKILSELLAERIRIEFLKDVDEVNAVVADLLTEVSLSRIVPQVEAQIEQYRGERGPTGLTGPPGDRGPAGPVGPQGITGLNGSDGKDAELPFGMVAAFLPGQLGSPACPDGWQIFSEGQGRFILGAKENMYEPGQRGGAEPHAFTFETAAVPVVGQGGFFRYDVFPDNKGPKVLDNLPPYIALYFCKKD